jgi:hypothetical protein
VLELNQIFEDCEAAHPATPLALKPTSSHWSSSFSQSFTYTEPTSKASATPSGTI